MDEVGIIGPNCWERQPRETHKSFGAFAIYRDLGRERRIRDAAEKVGKCARLLERWSARYHWKERAAAWDMEHDRLARVKLVKERADMLERHIRISNAFLAKVVERLGSLKPDELKPGDVKEWLELAVKIERLSRGETTENHGLAAPDGGPVAVDVKRPDPEEVDAIAKRLLRHLGDRVGSNGSS